MSEDFDRMLIADMLREYADLQAMVSASDGTFPVRLNGAYSNASLRSQADLIEASEGRAVTALNGVSSEQVERGYQAAIKRQSRKSFNADTRGMVRVILEAACGVKS